MPSAVESILGNFSISCRILLYFSLRKYNVQHEHCYNNFNSDARDDKASLVKINIIGMSYFFRRKVTYKILRVKFSAVEILMNEFWGLSCEWNRNYYWYDFESIKISILKAVKIYCYFFGTRMQFYILIKD